MARSWATEKEFKKHQNFERSVESVRHAVEGKLPGKRGSVGDKETRGQLVLEEQGPLGCVGISWAKNIATNTNTVQKRAKATGERSKTAQKAVKPGIKQNPRNHEAAASEPVKLTMIKG